MPRLCRPRARAVREPARAASGAAGLPETEDGAGYPVRVRCLISRAARVLLALVWEAVRRPAVHRRRCATSSACTWTRRRRRWCHAWLRRARSRPSTAWTCTWSAATMAAHKAPGRRQAAAAAAAVPPALHAGQLVVAQRGRALVRRAHRPELRRSAHRSVAELEAGIRNW